MKLIDELSAPPIAAVVKGIELLNRTLDRDWIWRVDLDRLDMNNTELCVLGQLYGGFENGMKTLFPAFTDAKGLWATGDEYGFSTSDIYTAYEALTSEWRVMITMERYNLVDSQLSEVRL
jgi:hypothetical protein